jgi:hypothetical protein
MTFTLDVTQRRNVQMEAGTIGNACLSSRVGPDMTSRKLRSGSVRSAETRLNGPRR